MRALRLFVVPIALATLAATGVWLYRAAPVAPAAPKVERPLPRLVLLYAPCTVSTRFLAPYDPSIDYTPRLARFAQEGVTFRRHQSARRSATTATTPSSGPANRWRRRSSTTIRASAPTLLPSSAWTMA